MAVCHNPCKQVSILRKRRLQAIRNKQTMSTCPVLAILLFANCVWGMSPSIEFVHSPKQPSLVLTYSASCLSPSTAELHSHSAGAAFQAAEAFLLRTAQQSVLLPKAPMSGPLIMTPSCTASCYGLALAAITVCSFKATVLNPHEYRGRVKNYLSTEPIQLPFTVQRLLFGVQTMAVMTMFALLAAGLLLSYMRPDIDDRFCLPAALIFLLFCMQIIVDQPTLDMTLVAVALLPKLGLPAVMQLAAFFAPVALGALYALWTVACILWTALAVLYGFCCMAATPLLMVMMLPLLTWHASMCRPFQYVARVIKIASPVIMKILIAFLFLLLIIEVGDRAPPMSALDLLGTLKEVYTSHASNYVRALLTVWAVPILCSYSILRFLVWPTCEFIRDTFFSDEGFSVRRLVSLVRVYTSLGLVLSCSSEHIAQSLLLLLLLIGGVEPNPGPAINVLAICAMMVLSPRPRNSLDMAGKHIF